MQREVSLCHLRYLEAVLAVPINLLQVRFLRRFQRFQEEVPAVSLEVPVANPVVRAVKQLVPVRVKPPVPVRQVHLQNMLPMHQRCIRLLGKR